MDKISSIEPAAIDHTAVANTTQQPEPAAEPAAPTLDELATRARDAIASMDRADESLKKARAVAGEAAKKRATVVGEKRIAAATALLEAQKRVKEEDQITWKQWLADNKIGKSEGYIRRLIAIAKAADPAKALADANEKAASGMRESRDKKNGSVRTPERTNAGDVGPHPTPVDAHLTKQITQLSVRFAELLGPINDRDTLVAAFAIFDRETNAVRDRATRRFVMQPTVSETGRC